jgi:hypothetical protein
MDSVYQFLSLLGVKAIIGILLAGAVTIIGRFLWKPREGRAARKIEIRHRQGMGSTEAIQRLAEIIEKQERQGRAWSFAQNLVWFMLGSGFSFFTPELRHVVGLPGRPMEIGEFRSMSSGDRESAMRACLAWKIDLVNQMATNDDQRFKVAKI